MHSRFLHAGSTALGSTCRFYVICLWQVVPALLQALRTMLSLRSQRARLPNQLAAMLDRGLLKLAKSVTQIQQTHPWCAAMKRVTNRVGFGGWAGFGLILRIYVRVELGRVTAERKAPHER